MGTKSPREVVLDTGALIAVERFDEKMEALLELALTAPMRFIVPAPVVAQAWRDGRRQARLARFLKAPQVEIVSMTAAQARATGELCALTETRDVVDACVVVVARESRCGVVTSDPRDLAKLDPTLTLHAL